MTRAQELARLIRAARQRAFLCEHGIYRNQCGWCILESKFGRMRSIPEIMALGSFTEKK